METSMLFLRTMDINLTRIVFISMSITTGALGLLINSLENYLPTSVTRVYRYGKYAVTAEHVFISRFEVPKRWFQHFYEFAAPASCLVLILTISKYIYNNPVPQFLHFVLDAQLGSLRQALVTPENTLLAMILLTVQCCKRLYETHCVSVFSDRKMNGVHYILGFIHYIGVLTCVVGESEGFVRGSNSVLRWDRINSLHYICAITFLLASYEQLRCNYILANLRKDKKGNVVAKSYKMPCGRLFEYISAPLQFTEIIMYTTLSIILWRSSTYHYICLWVIINQTETAILTHEWNLKTFHNYPKERKTLIPYLF